MSALVEAAVGGTVAFAGFLSGAFSRPRRPKRVKPICTCEHGYGMHGPDGCHHETRTYDTLYDAERGEEYAANVRHKCPCKSYDGPVPDFRLVP